MEDKTVVSEASGERAFDLKEFQKAMRDSGIPRELIQGVAEGVAAPLLAENTELKRQLEAARKAGGT